MGANFRFNCDGHGCQRLDCLHCREPVIARWVAGIDFAWDRHEPEYLDDDHEPPHN